MSASEDSLRRSDLIRQRRARQSRRRPLSKNHKRDSKTRIVSPPPVLVREGSTFSQTVELGNRAIRRPKRRYDVALSTPGAEVRLPSLPRVRIGWRLLSILLFMMLVVALYIAWNSPTYRVSHIEVKGLQRLKVEEIESILELDNQLIFMVEPRAIEKKLLSTFPQLNKVHVQVDVPAKVRINVSERQPVLVWKQGEETLWVDSMGVAFTPHGEPAPVVIVEAEDSPFTSPQSEELFVEVNGHRDEANGQTKRFLPPQLVSAILAISHRLPNHTTLKYSNVYGLGWRDERGFDVYFGIDTTDAEMKMQVYQAIVEYLDKEQIQPVMVSVEHLHAPYFRLER